MHKIGFDGKMEAVRARAILNLNSRKGISKIISIIVIMGIITSITIVAVYYPEIFQNKNDTDNEADDIETPPVTETSTEGPGEPDQGNLGISIEVLSTNITEWRHIGGDYKYYQIQFRIKNMGNEDLEIEYIVVDTHVASEKSTEETRQLIGSSAISEYGYLTEIQNKIVTFGGETDFTIYTEDLRNETEYSMRLHFADDEDFTFNFTANITSADIVEYPKFLKIEVQGAVCTRHPTGANWTIIWKLHNSGTKTEKLRYLSINGRGPDSFGASTPVPDGQFTTDMDEEVILPSGRGIEIKIFIDDTCFSFKTGTTINIQLNGASGQTYIKLVELV